MPELVRAPTREVRSRVFDSARWAGYQPRADDIIIGTYSKCGTTWMQRIVSMLVLKSAEPHAIWDLSPWPDMRFFGPIEETLAHAEAMTHRRFFKTHLPIDAVPLYRGVKVIHVARDGRDAALSLHNHLTHFTDAAIGMANQISLADPKFGDPWPTPAADPADFFDSWIEDGGAQGDPATGFWETERAYWAARREPDVLLVHYADLKADRAGEMRRVADFLDIDIPEALWPELVDAAGFEAMRQSGAELIPAAAQLWDDGASRFLHKGSNGRWRDLYRPADLAAYEARVASEFSPALAAWVASGRLATDDPRLAPD
jgi:aryl sulfotransferase